MLKKVWETLLLVVILMVVVNIAVASLKPFLPVIGLFLTGALCFGAYKIISRRSW